MENASEVDCCHLHKRTILFPSGDLHRFRYGQVLPHAGGGAEGGSNHRAWGKGRSLPPTLKRKWPPLWNFFQDDVKQAGFLFNIKTVTKQEQNLKPWDLYLCRDKRFLFCLQVHSWLTQAENPKAERTVTQGVRLTHQAIEPKSTTRRRARKEKQIGDAYAYA